MARTYPKKTGKGEPAVILYAMIAPGYSWQETSLYKDLPDGRLYFVFPFNIAPLSRLLESANNQPSGAGRRNYVHLNPEADRRGTSPACCRCN